MFGRKSAPKAFNLRHFSSLKFPEDKADYIAGQITSTTDFDDLLQAILELYNAGFTELRMTVHPKMSLEYFLALVLSRKSNLVSGMKYPREYAAWQEKNKERLLELAEQYLPKIIEKNMADESQRDWCIKLEMDLLLAKARVRNDKVAQIEHDYRDLVSRMWRNPVFMSTANWVSEAERKKRYLDSPDTLLVFRTVVTFWYYIDFSEVKASEYARDLLETFIEEVNFETLVRDPKNIRRYAQYLVDTMSTHPYAPDISVELQRSTIKSRAAKYSVAKLILDAYCVAESEFS